MKLHLPQVTLLIIDCVDFNRAKLSFDHCTTLCQFAESKILTNLQPESSFVTTIEPIKSLAEYNNFMIKELTRYFTTSHVLVAQWDGFILDTNLWDNQFLDYDYCGAPWTDETITSGIDKKYNVGNGGFSLRSKRLQDFLATDSRFVTSRPGKYFPWDYIYPEDVAICQINRPLLESCGFKFATELLASKFSWENGEERPTFGHHGRFTLPM